MTQQEKYDILTQDFLDRGDHFVRISQENRLGWEETLPVDGEYSSAILNPKSEEELVQNAVRLAKQMIVSMNAPFKVNIRISPDTSMTDSRTVWVATNVLDDQRLTLGKRLDTFLGLAIHEGSHLVYTDFKNLNEHGKDNRIIKDIANIVEDERIERNLGEESPGLANFLKAVKYYYFDSYMRQVNRQPLHPVERLLNTFLLMTRYPASMNKDDIMEFADELLQIREVLTPFPDSTASVRECAVKIFDIIKRFVTEDMLKQNSKSGKGQKSKSSQKGESKDSGQQQQQQQGGSNQQGSSKDDNNSQQGQNGQNGEQSQDSGSSNGNDQDEQDNARGGASGDDQQDDQQDGSQSGKDSDENEESGQDETDNGENDGDESDSDGDNQDEDGDSEEEEDLPDLTDEEMEEILRRMIEAMEEITNDPTQNEPDPSEVCNAARKDDYALAKECDGLLERGTLPHSLIYDAPGSKDQYNDSVKRIRKYIPAIRSALTAHYTEYRYVVPCTRTGILDTNKLAEARQGSDTVYYQQGEVKTDKINIVLVIDESGSMSDKYRMARDTAILIKEAVGNLHNVGLYIYGYTDDGRKTYIFRFQESDHKNDKYALGSIAAIGGTPTYEAIIEAAARVRKTNREKTLMLVISDGEPNSSYRVVGEATRKLVKDNFQTVGVTISPALREETMKQMYDHYIVINDLATLAKRLGTVVKQAILKQKRG